MGMYTELRFVARLKPDTPPEVIELLSLMVKGEGKEFTGTLPEHSLFVTSRWNFMLNCDSYYFNADTGSTLRFDNIANQYFLNVQCNFKNYENELKKFLNWVMPYIDAEAGEHLGHHRYEEDNGPSLIFYEKEAIAA